MDDHDEILERALAIARERHPNATPERHSAFANAVAYAVTGESGGYGGPSVREHAASRVTGAARLRFDLAVEELIRPNGLIFGPLSNLHRLCWDQEDCFDDDPADVRALTSS